MHASGLWERGYDLSRTLDWRSSGECLLGFWFALSTLLLAGLVIGNLGDSQSKLALLKRKGDA